MLNKERPFIYLMRVLESIELIEEYVKDIRNIEEFRNDKKSIDAVLMQLIHIWETINKFYKKYWNQYILEIPYKNIIWFRNFVAHDYLGININIVWNIIKKELPKLKAVIKSFLKSNWYNNGL